MSVLYQLQHHWLNGRTELVAQKDIRAESEYRKWVKEITQTHPLPDGASWRVCNELSEYFVMAVKDYEALKDR